VLDERSPIYLQIADTIKEDVLRGTLEGGEQIMSTNQYAATFQINPATAAKAFARLVAEGVIYRKRGIGMFVSADARDKLRDRRRERFFADVVDPMMSEARMVGVSMAEIRAYIERST